MRRAKPRRAAAVRGMGHAVSRRGCGQRGGAGPRKLGRGAGREGGRESAAGPPGSRPKPGKGREKRAGPSLELG